MSVKLKNASLIGSVLTGVLASVCCIGPIVFALLGIGGAGFILKFEAYRPLFAGVAILFLVVGGYLTYRKPTSMDCSPGSLCANPKSNRINKVVFWIAAIIVLLALLVPTILGWFI